MRPNVSTTRAISMAALLLTIMAVLPWNLHGQIRPLRALLTIRALDGGAESISAVPVRLNFDRSVSWVAKGHTEPPVYDTNGVPEVVLTVLLHFDTSGSGNDVSKLVQPLDNMASIDVNLGRPPLVQVQFGAIDFKGVISSVAAKYTDFKEDGTPVRADVDVKIKVAASAEVGVLH